MIARVLVTLKDEVLDAPGRALTERLASIGYGEVKNARIGKFIELEIESGDRQNAEGRVREMCEKLLANHLTEEFEILEEEVA